MPLRTAARRCPEAVFLPVDKDAYDAASAQVMDVLRSFDLPVEVLGWDEAFLAAPGEHRGDPVALAQQIRAAVLGATGLHCSVGIGDNKLQAKIATDFGKPRGVYRISSRTWFEEMGARPTEALWGIGRKTAKRLADLGIETVADLAGADTRMLAERLGPTMGPWYRRLGRGVDSSPVDATPYVARGHGRETTFQENLSDWGRVADAVRDLSAQVGRDLAAEGRAAVRVGVKVRYAPFETRSRSRTLPAPTADADDLAAVAVALLADLDHSRSVRLVGVRAEMEAPHGQGPVSG
jgi:DNA polymerase-4